MRWTLAALFMLAISPAAQAAVTVFGDGPERACYIAAKTNINPTEGLARCTEALATGLNHHDEAATLVNRGVLEHRLGRMDEAVADFDACLALEPHQADAFLNRGAVLISLKRSEEALQDIEQGIALGVSEPAVGYYDRAIAEENLGRIADAYRDYRRALAVAPYLVQASDALKRFKVVPRNS